MRSTLAHTPVDADDAAPHAASRGDRRAALRAADWLALGAAPTFACMAVLTGLLSGGPGAMVCSAATHMSALSGMVPMYVLMSAFHVAPWLTFVSRRRAGARIAGAPHQTARPIRRATAEPCARPVGILAGR